MNLRFQNTVQITLLSTFFLVSAFVSGYGSFLDKPENPTTVTLNDCANFSWKYRLRKEDHIVDVSFGEWSPPGYLSRKLLVRKPNGQSLTRSAYEKKVRWVGDLANCTAAVEMCNITKADLRTYGVHIELGLDKNPMTAYFRLDVRDEGMPSLPAESQLTTTQTASTVRAKTTHAHVDVLPQKGFSRRRRILITISVALLVTLLVTAVLVLWAFIRKRVRHKSMKTKLETHIDIKSKLIV